MITRKKLPQAELNALMAQIEIEANNLARKCMEAAGTTIHIFISYKNEEEQNTLHQYVGGGDLAASAESISSSAFKKHPMFAAALVKGIYLNLKEVAGKKVADKALDLAKED